MAKMRVSQHSGREGGGKHNDRQFDLDKAEHIDAERSRENCYWRWDLKSHPERTFEESEREFYAARYGVAQQTKNERYVRERHAERCKTIDDLMTGKQTRAEEIILQIGNKDAHTDNETFLQAVNDYFKELQHWNHAHGDHMQIISIAVHYDETTPHAHIRRTWDIEGKDGAVLGQNKALKAAGVQLPDPDKAEGRYNNRKMSFDAMMRERWLDICEKRGLDIEREAVPDMRHKDKAEYIRQEIGAEIDALKDNKTVAERETAATLERAADARNEAAIAETMMHEAHKQERAQIERIDAQAERLGEIERQAEQAGKRLEIRQNAFDNLEHKANAKLADLEAIARQVREREATLDRTKSTEELAATAKPLRLSPDRVSVPIEVWERTLDRAAAGENIAKQRAEMERKAEAAATDRRRAEQERQAAEQQRRQTELLREQIAEVQRGEAYEAACKRTDKARSAARQAEATLERLQGAVGSLQKQESHLRDSIGNLERSRYEQRFLNRYSDELEQFIRRERSMEWER